MRATRARRARDTELAQHPAGPSEEARRVPACGAVALPGGRVLWRMRRDARERGEVEVEALEAWLGLGLGFANPDPNPNPNPNPNPDTPTLTLI